jgi:plasmid stabilization system protein ParE
VRYIALDNQQAGESFRGAIQDTCEIFVDLPEIGSACNFDNPELEGLRMLPVPKFKKYLIFYRPTSERVEIVRVLHSACGIPVLFGEPAAENGQEQRAA